MSGKPQDCSFPEEGLTVKDRFGLDNERLGPNPAFDSYRYPYHQAIPQPGDSRQWIP